jgi:Ca2+/Na+ antiporter
MEVIIFFLLLLVSIYTLSLSSELFIESASGLGFKLRLPDYLIGSLIVGVGTSLPELITSVVAVYQGQPILVTPNVYGTVVANIFVGLGLSVVFLYLFVKVDKKTIVLTVDQPYGGGSLDFGEEKVLNMAMPVALFSVFLSYFLSLDGSFSRIDSVFFLIGYTAFIVTEIRKSSNRIDESESFKYLAKKYKENSFSALAKVFFSRKKRSMRKYALTVFNRYILLHKNFLFVAATYGVIYLALSNFTSTGFTNGTLQTALLFASLIFIPLIDVSLILKWLKFDKKSNYMDFREYVFNNSFRSSILYMIFSIVLLLVSGHFVIKSIIELSDYLSIQSTVLVASIVALGTSLPDIVVAVKVARKGRYQLLIGHIIQSNVFDVFLIMAVCGLIIPLPIDTQSMQFTILFAIAANLLLFSILQDNNISVPEGILMLISYVVFVGLLYGII